MSRSATVWWNKQENAWCTELGGTRSVRISFTLRVLTATVGEKPSVWTHRCQTSKRGAVARRQNILVNNKNSRRDTPRRSGRSPAQPQVLHNPLLRAERKRNRRAKRGVAHDR
jgi:hypothetical protein